VIGLSPTTTIRGAPYEIVRMAVVIAAAAQDEGLSMLSGNRLALIGAP
jgi:hypothetical protein